MPVLWLDFRFIRVFRSISLNRRTPSYGIRTSSRRNQILKNSTFSISALFSPTGPLKTGSNGNGSDLEGN